MPAPLYEYYYKLFEQERIPVCTWISFVITVAVETVIFLAADSIPQASFGAIGIAIITSLLVLLGVVINIVLGCLAYKRHEFWGGRIATLGIAVWLVTIVVLRR